MIKILELALSLAMTLGIYYPLFKRVLKRKHTRDFSKVSSWFIFLTQCNNFFLAGLEHAHYLMVWYVVQSLLCGIQLYFVYKFWNAPELRYRIRLLGNMVDGFRND